LGQNMLQNAVLDVNPSWPQPDEAGRYVLRPSRRKLFLAWLFCAVLALAGFYAAVTPARPAHPLDPLFGGLAALMFGAMTLIFPFAARRGMFTMTANEAGFSDGQIRCAWADVSGTFHLSAKASRFKLLVRYRTGTGVRQIINLYPMSTAALADFLNARLMTTRARPDAMPAMVVKMTPNDPLRRPEAFAPVTRTRRRTLPFGVWVAIGGVFLVLLVTGGPIAELVWQVAAPGNYAAHTLDDYDLSNKAGHDARFLPVLLARADAGDKSAMYFMGDHYDPTSFLCESTVQKNAATAVYWYNKAVPLDDQGAERALGNLYHQGLGVPRDDVMAAALLERAVAHNDDFGDYFLGQMLEAGQGEPQNLARAAQLEEASAAQGNDWGETELGRMYFAGIGVARDAGQAAKYWDQAAAQGDGDAQALLAQHGMP
jgi:TPR repeat protein